MSKRRERDYLENIREAMERITAYTEGMDYQGFLKDRKTQDATIRDFEVIGEAVKNISTELKEKYSQLPWKELAGFRDKLIHHYFGIKHDALWQASKDIKALIAQVEEVLNKEFRK